MPVHVLPAFSSLESDIINVLILRGSRRIAELHILHKIVSLKQDFERRSNEFENLFTSQTRKVATLGARLWQIWHIRQSILLEK